MKFDRVSWILVILGFPNLIFSCDDHEFECKLSHTCVSMSLRCNGVDDCPHGEDEDFCPAVCSDDEFLCNNLCLSKIFYCDGHYDCNDGSDENFCPSIRKNHTCSNGEFMCGEGTCIPDEFVCDDHVDCADEADEKNCNSDQQEEEIEKADFWDCPAPFYKCKDDKETCIPQRFVCDGGHDCEDGSDEVNCGEKLHHTQCLATEGRFACKKSTEYDVDVQCLAADHVCNGRPECPHGEDEGDICKSKKCKHRGCEQNCLETLEGPVCYCKEGYKLAKDGKSCEDIDECQEFGRCSQLCKNKKGGYECSCKEGYLLVNSTSCHYGGTAQVFIAMESDDGGEIRSYDFHTKKYLPVVKGVRQPVGIAYDLESNKIFWTDLTLGRSVVEAAKIDVSGSASNTSVLVETGLEHPEDLIFDSFSGLVYFSDSGKGRIVGCHTETSICTVISEDHQQPRGLAMHTTKRLLFITEWGSDPRIVRMQMDGSVPKLIITKDIVWPNGIVVDESIDRIYWTDAQRDTIETATLDGLDRRVIVDDVHHPFGIAVFEDKVYWSDWHDYRLFSCNKFSGMDLHILVKTPLRMNGISVSKSFLTLPENPCNESPCSHLCVPTGSITSEDSKGLYSCKCPENMHLQSDGISCDSNYLMDTSNYLVISTGNSLYSLRPQMLGKLSMEPVGFETGAVAGVSSHVINDIMIATTNTGHVLNVNVHQKSSQVISIESDIESLSFDPVDANLFWIDSQKKTIVMMSESSKQIRTLLKCSNPRVLTYTASKNMLAFVDGRNLLETTLNGEKTNVLSSEVPVNATSLVFSEGNKCFYISSGRRIYSISPAGIAFDISSGTSDIQSLTTQGDYLYWTEEGSNKLYWKNLRSNSEQAEVSSMVLNIPLNSTTHLSSAVGVGRHQGACAFRYCSDICIGINEDVAQCLCGDGRSLVLDGKWNTCTDDRKLPHDASKNDSNSNNDSTFLGMIISLCLVLVCLSIILGCFCFARRRRFKPTEFINRSFGTGTTPTKDFTYHHQMSSVEVTNQGGCNEVENPGFYAVNLTTNPGFKSSKGGCVLPTVNPAEEEEEKTGVIPRLINRLRSYGGPKMAHIDWSDGAVGYENLMAAKGSSTPSMKRLETIEESDSAYTDFSASMDYEDDGNFHMDHAALVN